MYMFVSSDNIVWGDDIAEKVLRGLTSSDILVIVLDPLAKRSRWVRWEYEFCLKRNIRRVHLASDRTFQEISEFPYLVDSSKAITYTAGENDYPQKVHFAIQSKS
jgi:hypothetical protein